MEVERKMKRMKSSKSRAKSRKLYTFNLYVPKKIEPSSRQVLGQISIPHSRSGHRSVVDDGNFYSFGGYNPYPSHCDIDMEGPLYRQLWRFNLATKCWSRVQTKGCMPKELASHSALLYGSTLLVYGGTGVPFGSTNSNTLHACDFKTMTWREVKTVGNVPPKLYGQSILLLDDKLYTFGGTTGFEYSSDLHCLHLKNWQWEELKAKNKPDERYRHEIASDGKYLYVFGGGTSEVCFKLSEIPAFDLQLRSWSSVRSLPDLVAKATKELGTTIEGYPSPRRCHSLVQRDDFVYICGGYDGEAIFPDIWRYNMKTTQWTRLCYSLPNPVYFHSAALSKSGCMYIFGGVVRIEGHPRTSDMYSVWVSLPSLRELCWQALQRYHAPVYTTSRNRWLQIGVPADLVKRIDYTNCKSTSYEAVFQDC